MIVGIVLLAAALMTGSPFISWLLYFLAATTLVVPRLSKAAFGALTVEYDLSHRYVFPGETVEAVVRIRQPSPLPLPWLEVWEPLSYPLQSVTPLSTTVSVPGKGAVTLAHRFQCHRRGVYAVGTVETAAGDWIGLERYRRRWVLRRPFVCFPTVYPVATKTLPRHLPIGPSPDRRSPFRDPHETVRLRPYLPGDPLRSVAWKVTARQSRLMVKEEERVREGALAIFLNADRREFQSLPPSAGIERVISVAASLVWAERGDRRAVGLFAYGAGGPVGFPPGEGSSVRLQILQGLAGLEGGEGVPFPSLWERDAAMLPPGATVVAVVPRATADVKKAAASIARRAHPVVVLTLEDGSDGRASGGIRTGASGAVAGSAGVYLWRVVIEGGAIRFV